MSKSIRNLDIDYFESLLADTLNQFKGDDKPNTLIMLNIIARQLQDLMTAAKETVVDTTLDNAVGAQLDGIGDIVKLNRKEAAVLANIATTNIENIEPALYDHDESAAEFLRNYAQNGIIPFQVLDDDERYRELLRFKIFLNNSECTYYDMMYALSMMWNTTKVSYSEDVENETGDDKLLHATVMLSTEELTPDNNGDDQARLFFAAPIIKAAGVSIIRKAETKTIMPTTPLKVAGAWFSPVMQTTLPMLEYDVPFDLPIVAKARAESVTQTILSNIEKNYNYFKFEIRFDENNEPYYEVVGLTTDSVGMNVTVPSTYYGIPVKSIAGGTSTQKTKSGALADSYIIGLTIPGNCSIGKYTLIRSYYIETIILEEGIEDIPDFFAPACSSLTTVYLPRSLKSIGRNFVSTSSLTAVYYAGTEEEWEQVEISSIGNSILLKANVVFNYVKTIDIEEE